MPTIETEIPDRRNDASRYLLTRAQNVHSQGGEDGVLQAIFERIGTRTKWCVEFGAWDGRLLSNTCNLIENFGWRGVQIEGDPEKFAKLQANFSGNTNVRQINAMIGFERGVDALDDALAMTDIPPEFDLLSIDIDGADWFVWQSVERFRARVVIVEINPTVPNDIVFIQDRDMSVSEGASLAAMIRLGREKGYELIAVTASNAIFVVREEFGALGIADNSIDARRLSPAGRIWHCESGRIYHSMTKLTWAALKREVIRPDSLQLLPPDRIRKAISGS